MKHTKGPWKLDWIFSGQCNIDPEDGHGRIATVWVRQTKTNNIAETTANAHLIASAPDLLGACRCALADLEGIMPEYEPDGERTHPAWRTILELKQAIAQAEGRR